MDQKQRVEKLEKLRDLILNEIKASTDRMDVVCWDKGCKLAMETTVTLAADAPETREELLAIAKDKDTLLKDKVMQALKSAAEIDVVIVPGVVFDRRGGRIGFGAGFYDRLLAGLSYKSTKIALAFELQVVENVPSQSHDIAVDYVVAERETIVCKG